MVEGAAGRGVFRRQRAPDPPGAPPQRRLGPPGGFVSAVAPASGAGFACFFEPTAPGRQTRGAVRRGGGGGGVAAARHPAREPGEPAGSTARRIALAIANGSRAAATAVFSSTPSAPSSIATAASEAEPTPASTITGTETRLPDQRDLFRFWMPSPTRWAPRAA